MAAEQQPAQTTYKIGEVAAMLRLKTHVLRFWETEFPQLAPVRTAKGQRLYREADVAMVRRIQQLLHEQGMTIDGARRILAGSAVLDENLPGHAIAVPDPGFMRMLRRELLALRRLINEG